ncbi:MAG: hypothetical protein HY298_06230 [Verrucomicrobia bacterium]|nr:hypothetical protein [Verrucomicrobiota bacterium]
MKTNIFSRKNRIAAGLVFALLLSGLEITAQAQNSPVGMWDFRMGHARQGTAYITFGDDFSVSGHEIFGPVPHGVNALVLAPKENSYGAAAISGAWGFDRSGQVVGFYTERATSNGTNTDIADPVSFVATVNPGKMSMRATIKDGSVVFLKGVPAIFLPDISGTYFGKGKTNGVNGVLFNEFFSLTLTDDPVPNAYDVVGTGAGGGPTNHNFTGQALLSANGQISIQSSFVIYTVETNVMDTNILVTNFVTTNIVITNFVVREFTGAINVKKPDPRATTTLRGVSGSDKILYKITRLNAPSPE